MLAKLASALIRLIGGSDSTIIGNVSDSLKTNVTNGSGGSAVNIQDGGNSITVDGIVSANQSGTWNINNVSGIVSLPTGAATAANQTAANSSLASLDTKTPTLGQKTSAGSSPVVIASDQSPIPVVEGRDYVYLIQPLRNGSSEALTVNGSGTPVNFDFTTNGVDWELESLAMFIQANGTPDPGDFGAISGSLSNGVELRIRSKGTEYLVSNITNNMQLFGVFRDFPGLPATSSGWWNNSDTYQGVCTFNKPIKLLNSSSDFVRVRIRDNLTGIDNLRIFAKLRRVI